MTAQESFFAGQREKTSRWQIWEMGVDGSRKRQLTHCDIDCLRSAYLPRDEIVYTALKSDDPTGLSQLYVSKGNGSGGHPITFGPGNFLVETVLQDGRILVSASGPLKPGVEGTRELYTLRPDGTGLTSFRCDHKPGLVRDEAAELEDGSVVFVKRHSASEPGGELATVRRGSLHNSPIGLTPDLYLSAGGWEAGLAVVALKGSRAGNESSGLYAFDVGSPMPTRWNTTGRPRSARTETSVR